MSVLEFSSYLMAVGVATGLLGSLTGMGGGVILVPALVLLFGVDIRYAIGASLVSVIATSSGAAVAFVREGYANLRIAMFLEVAAVLGAIAGALLAGVLHQRVIAVVFGVVLILSAWLSLRRHEERETQTRSHPWAVRLRLEGSYPTAGGPRPYRVDHVPAGFSLMGLAGVLSGLLGIGSGAVKVLAMDQAMRLPYKVSTATSNFVIGITAATSAGIYFARGNVDPGLTMPVMLGTLVGSIAGAKIMAKAATAVLRVVFSIVILVVAIEMVYHGLTGKL